MSLRIAVNDDSETLTMVGKGRLVVSASEGEPTVFIINAFPVSAGVWDILALNQDSLATVTFNSLAESIYYNNAALSSSLLLPLPPPPPLSSLAPFLTTERQHAIDGPINIRQRHGIFVVALPLALSSSSSSAEIVIKTEGFAGALNHDAGIDWEIALWQTHGPPVTIHAPLRFGGRSPRPHVFYMKMTLLIEGLSVSWAGFTQRNTVERNTPVHPVSSQEPKRGHPRDGPWAFLFLRWSSVRNASAVTEAATALLRFPM
jgi:hypothetical protein